MRALALSPILLLIAGCSSLNILKGQNDYYANHYAYELRQTIDDAISRETAEEPPSGYLTKPYSRSIWNSYWNDRIYYLYDLGGAQTPDAYQGPDGQEFISYIFEARASVGLPAIEVEERNIDRVPAT
jgi:hypothetical protein